MSAEGPRKCPKGGPPDDDGGVPLLRCRRHIGDLPPHVLTHILSFLPTIDAVKTAFVSRSWRALWADLPHLDPDAENFFTQPPELDEPGAFSRFYREYLRSDPPPPVMDPEALSRALYGPYVDAAAVRFAGFADWVIRRRFDPRGAAALRSLRLRFYSERNADRVDEWVHLAMSGGGGVEDLHLSFADKHAVMTQEEDLYVLEGDRVGAAAAGSRSSLVSLTLRTCKLVAQGFGRFASLKSLVLSAVCLPSGSVTDMMSKCPVLQELSMSGCMLQGFFVIPGSSLRLQSLELLRCYDYESGTLSFQICAPKLSRFKFDGNLGPVCSVVTCPTTPLMPKLMPSGDLDGRPPPS